MEKLGEIAMGECCCCCGKPDVVVTIASHGDANDASFPTTDIGGGN